MYLKRATWRMPSSFAATLYWLCLYSLGPTAALAQGSDPVETDVFPESVGQMQLEIPASTIVVSPSAALPPLEAVYVTAQPVFATFHGPDLEIILQDARQRALADPPPVITPVGADEEEFFQSSLRATAILTGMGLDHARIPVEFLGPVTTRAAGKVGQTTGTFATEMLAMNLSGPIGPLTVLIRESPTRASGGRTSVASGSGGGGGGGYRIDSFFDIWVEISVDGGQSWTLADDVAHLQAQSVGVQTPHPGLPPTDGMYRTPGQVQAEYLGPGLEIEFRDFRLTQLRDVTREMVGEDEIERFQCTAVGVATINGMGLVDYLTAVSLNGPVETIAHGRAVNPTGSFTTEILSMNLTGEAALPSGLALPLRIRESPTRASLGRTSVRDLGNGTFHIDSFFDIWTELSLDGGLTWTPSTTSTAMELTNPPRLETVEMVGPTTVKVFFEGAEGRADDDDGDRRDEVATEMTQLDLRGSSSLGPLALRLDAARRTLGQIEEMVNLTAGTLDLAPFTPTGLADSFFDVFFQIEVGGQVLHGVSAAHMAAVIRHKPPQAGERYVSPQPLRVPLADADGNWTGVYVVRAIHQPAPTLEVDVFTDTTALVELLVGPLGTPLPCLLRGPTEVHVYFEGPNAGDAFDDDADGLDEVISQLVGMNLTDGNVTLRVRNVLPSPGVPSLGGVEEQANNTAGTLDLRPFTAAGTADSFFDVFFEIELPDGSVLHNEQPVRLRAVIDHKPPIALYLFAVPASGPVELVDELGLGTDVYLVGAEHYTGHIERDVFPESVGKIELEIPASKTVVTPSAALPPLEAMYASTEPVFATFHGPDWEIILQDARHRPFADPPPVITAVGSDEVESFQSSLRATAIVTGIAGHYPWPLTVEFLGSVTTRALDKVGQTTGTFATEMLAMTLSGQIGTLPVMIRESPTRASGGSTSVASGSGGGGGGGGYQIDSFFDIWVEISVDGGTSWTLASDVAHLQAQSVGVQTPDSTLPPTDGVYRTPGQVQVEYLTPGLQITLRDFRLTQLRDVTREILGADEVEHFQCTAVGVATVVGTGTGQEGIPVEFFGPVTTKASDKAGRIEGTFEAEMGQLDLTGGLTLPTGAPLSLLIRESPTRASLGRTAVRDLGNGTYHIDSFFDIWTELSLDGGQTWTPSTTSTAVELTNPPRLETVDLAGPTTFDVFFEGTAGQADDDDLDGREEVATEMVQLVLAGTSSLGPVQVSLSPATPSVGQFEEQANNTAGRLDVAPFTPAGMVDSFFDVFFEITLQTSDGPVVLHNQAPKTMRAQLDHKPPTPGTVYENPDRTELYLADGSPSGFYLRATQQWPVPELDFGDLPETSPLGVSLYPTLVIHNGPRHVIVNTLRLGEALDPERDGQPTPRADGDDLNGATPDDEEAVPATSLTGLIRGGTATVPVSVYNTSGANGTLWAWLDFNANGAVETGETQTVPVGSSATVQTVNLSFGVPVGALPNAFARFRLGTVPSEVMTPSGWARNGEVEDYPITTQTTPTGVELDYFRAVRTGADDVRLVWGTLVESDLLGFRLERSGALGEWAAVAPGILPAQGQDSRPHTYRFEDTAAQAVTQYRLVGVNLRGEARVLAAATVNLGLALRVEVTGGDLRIECRGQPNGSAVVETTVDPARGPWEPVETVQLDGTGTVTVTRTLGSAEPMRFYRVRE